jgi:hypothetical protein
MVGKIPSVGQNAEVQEAFTALGELVMRQKRHKSPMTSTYTPLIDRSLGGTDPEKMARPPWSVVKAAIDKATGC